VPDLDSRLARSRAALLDEIDQPPLADVHRRAGRIRRWRAAKAGAAALALVAVVAVAARPWETTHRPPVTPAATPTVAAPVYRGAGVEITGLAPGTVLNVDGEVVDVEFSDADHGLAFAICGQTGCPALAKTDDGGLTWTSVALPESVDNDSQLVAFPGGRTLLVQGGASYFASADGGTSWQRATPAAASPRPVIGDGQLPRLDVASGAVTVWSPDHGPLGPLARQPDLTVSWVAAAPAADGAWWVGGTSGGEPAVAVTRDGGATWQRTVFGAASGAVETVRIGFLGTDVYAVASGEAGLLRNVYYSADGGTTFKATFAGGEPTRVSGEPVPLLDGRLLLTGHDDSAEGTWWVSADDGKTFTAAPNLPAVGTVNRTIAGYVAYRLFDSGWLAFSTNGLNWQKLQLY